MNEKILILTGNFGDGHRQAAIAVQKFLMNRKPNAEVEVVDFMELAHPLTHAVSRYFFIQSLKMFPSFYGYVYNKTRRTNQLSMLLKKTNRLGMGRLLKLLQDVRPTTVVSTFPLASGTMSVLKAQGLTDVRTMTVITDHTDHGYWVYPYTDKYIVGSEIVRDKLAARDVPRDRIDVTGIPVRQEFREQYDRYALARKHGLNPAQPIALIMGGGCGLFGGELLKHIQSLEMLSTRMQFLIVCGSNERLRQQLKEATANSRHTYVITGYIDFVHEFMAIADLLVTKPGGLTSSEAMAMGLPMLICKPLPGQEEDNERFLLQEGVALRIDAESDLFATLERVARDPGLLRGMRERMIALHRSSSKVDIADAVFGSVVPSLESDYRSAQVIPYVI